MTAIKGPGLWESVRQDRNRVDLTSFELLSFDCYGTIIDWETGILSALRPIMTTRGLNPADDELLHLYAQFEHEAQDPHAHEYRTYREVLGEVMAGFATHYDLALDAHEHDALADSLGRWPIFPDSRAALHTLARRYKLAILSNIDNDLFAQTRAALGVDLNFVVTAELCRSYKPAEKHWRVLRALSGVDKDRMLHVAESRFHDIIPAKGMGISTAWVNRRGGLGKGDGGASEGAREILPFDAQPDLEVHDLGTLARLCESDWSSKRW